LSASKQEGQPRIALVTGASRGIGRAAALALARSGAHVVALARTQGGLEELDDEIRALRPDEPEATTLVPMDLRDFAAIDRLGEALHRRWGRLDALVGNAGVLGVLTPLHQLDPKTWEDVMAVNVTANWRLIRSLDPLLRLSGAGRVAFITSGAASRADLRAYWGPYAVSKAALDALARTYAAETVNTSNERPRDADQSGAAAYADARDRHARRRSVNSARTAGPRAQDRRDLLARVDRDGEALRFSNGSDSELSRSRLKRRRTPRLALRSPGCVYMRGPSLRPAGG
jgi:NAD(P)-dependent dehydrogenase (short-subunit alcohol dehydrogenase family)